MTKTSLQEEWDAILAKQGLSMTRAYNGSRLIYVGGWLELVRVDAAMYQKWLGKVLLFGHGPDK